HGGGRAASVSARNPPLLRCQENETDAKAKRRATPMNTKLNVVAAGFVCAALLLASSSRADSVTDWNELLDSVAPRYGGPQQ
ncbi:MAG TPA: hypothetical protein VF861_13975, partial [Telluria sp.]